MKRMVADGINTVGTLYSCLSIPESLWGVQLSEDNRFSGGSKGRQGRALPLSVQILSIHAVFSKTFAK